MAFDAGMLACVIAEVRQKALGARIEKVFQPERDEIVLQMRSIEGGKRLLINAGSNNPRFGFTNEQKENPMTPPMLCMLLRKHLQGAKLSDVRQEGFERVVTLEFETRDEMGFECRRYLIAEIMGKYSNLIFANEDKKIVSALHIVDFSTSGLRQILPGMTYELPPKQDKTEPFDLSYDRFLEMMQAGGVDRPADKWITATFLGISAAVAREIAYRGSGSCDAPLGVCRPERLYRAFCEIMGGVREARFSPCMVLQNGKPCEYAFCELTHYGADFEMRRYESAGLLLDEFFHTRDRENHIRQRAADVLRILTNADARIRKKLELQRGELKDCEKGAEYKKCADLITANLYLLSRGMTRAELTDYEDWHEDGSYGSVTVELDSRLSPSANAQVYYKKYNKCKNAKMYLTEQIAAAQNELHYLETVSQALDRAETEADLVEIRQELAKSGYASRMHGFKAAKPTTVKPMEFRTSGGYRMVCGKNNTQNDYITFKLAGKLDLWFHVKGAPGSHVVLICNGEEPSEQDYTEAAVLAATYSGANGSGQIPVDYTRVKNIKKPPASKPGYVTYSTNYTAYVESNEKLCESLRVKR